MLRGQLTPIRKDHNVPTAAGPPSAVGRGTGRCSSWSGHTQP